jgi:hypothetical protein
MTYQILDIFFIVFHTAIILFNLFGWIWRRTRRWNLYLLWATAFSWAILGIWYGFGYCPCTDWHWQVLEAMGREPATPSYIEYLIERLFPIAVSYKTANALTLWAFVGVLLISTVLNGKDYIQSVKN